MTGDRLLRILSKLSLGDGASFGARRLCQVAAEVSVVSGAGIMLLADDLPQGSLSGSDRRSELLDDLQFTLGEGPCVDAHVGGTAVLEPDLAVAAEDRWPGFTPLALEAGTRAVFGFPVRIGAVRFGALNLYRDTAGPLSADQYADSGVMASVVARAIVTMQADASPGVVSAGLVETSFPLVVHQAAGMVSVQLASSVAEALLRLRSHAFVSGRLLAKVAEDVVERRLRFDKDHY